MASSPEDLSLIYLPPPPVPVVHTPDDYTLFRDTATPLVIDNGSADLRCAFATSPVPHTGTNVVARFKERKTSRMLLVFGDAVEIDSGARAQAKTPWEGDVLLNFDALVRVLPIVSYALLLSLCA